MDMVRRSRLSRNRCCLALRHSSAIRRTLSTFGAFFQPSGTDISEPSQVYSFGIASPGLNAELLNSNAMDGMSFQFRSFDRFLRPRCRRRRGFSCPCGGISLAFRTCGSYRRFRRFAGSPLAFSRRECFEIRKRFFQWMTLNGPLVS